MSDLNDYINAGSSEFSNLLFTRFADSDLSLTELMVYLFLAQHVQTHTEAPDLGQLAASAKMAEPTFMNALNRLCAKGAVILQTTTDDAGRLVDRYDVSPLMAQLLQVATKTSVTSDATSTTPLSPVRQVMGQVETEFGRLLTPIEQQMIRDWLNVDRYKPELVSLALREAVLNQAYSLKYMDRVLLRWEKQHLTTPEAVRRAQQKFDSL